MVTRIPMFMVVNFEVERDGYYFPYQANVRAIFIKDTNYGADVDGNRGEIRTYLETLIVNDVRELTYRGEVLATYAKEEDLKEWYSTIWDKVEEIGCEDA